jgi:hypothetical protein
MMISQLWIMPIYGEENRHLHKTYDEVSAILAGDALNTYAFEVLSNAPFSDRVIVKLVRSLSLQRRSKGDGAGTGDRLPF